MDTFALLSLRAVIGVVVKTLKSITGSPVTSKTSVAEKSAQSTRIFVPNVLAKWPWPRCINPHHDVVKKEGIEWMKGFQAFSPKAQDAFDRSDFTLLSSMAFPTVNREHSRAGSRLMLFLFVFDEYSDMSTPSEVRMQKDVIMDALRNPHTPRPKGEWIGGEMGRQFWEITIQNATMVSQKRFIENMDEFLESVVQESIDRKHHRIRDVKTYMDARRLTVGTKISLFISELGFEIPDEVISHPALQEMIISVTDIIALTNDAFSYNLEQMRGEVLHNIITCVMNEHHTDVNGAMLWVVEYLVDAVEKFQTARAALPTWEEPLNSQVQSYCDGLGHWVRANYEWAFESERYFGNRGLEIKKTRWMSLLPKKVDTEVGPVHVDGCLL